MQLAREHGYGVEEFERILHRHVEYFADVLVFVLHLKRLAVIAFAFADVTRHINVREKVHLYLDHAIALTGFTATALHIETESPRFVAAGSCFRGLRKQFAHWGEQARVGCGI